MFKITHGLHTCRLIYSVIKFCAKRKWLIFCAIKAFPFNLSVKEVSFIKSAGHRYCYVSRFTHVYYTSAAILAQTNWSLGTGQAARQI